jgi:hypothetical protein
LLALSNCAYSALSAVEGATLPGVLAHPETTARETATARTRDNDDTGRNDMENFEKE